mgnify:CR=1 FL=1
MSIHFRLAVSGVHLFSHAVVEASEIDQLGGVTTEDVGVAVGYGWHLACWIDLKIFILHMLTHQCINFHKITFHSAVLEACEHRADV